MDVNGEGTFLVDETRRSYDAVADEYAARIAGELANKPFDRAFLDAYAAAVPAGPVVELGSGSGHVAAYLGVRGVDISGLDLSPAMVEQARRLFPDVPFVVGDMLDLPFADASLSGGVAFYSIIHFSDAQLAQVLAGIGRVLRPGGLLALAFHVGDETMRREEWWGRTVKLDSRLLPTAFIVDLLANAGLEVTSASERDPLAPEVEYQSRRAYIVARRPGADAGAPLATTTEVP